MIAHFMTLGHFNMAVDAIIGFLVNKKRHRSMLHDVTGTFEMDAWKQQKNTECYGYLH